MRLLATAAILTALAGPVFAQSLTPEQLVAMIDERVATLNPYQALLNDPDPERSMAAMQIMMESGDETLIRMAREFGLTSPDPTVRRTALEAFLKTKPVLTMKFTGKDVKDTDYRHTLAQRWNAALDPEMNAYYRFAFGEYDAEQKCFDGVTESEGKCVATLNTDGLFFDWRNRNSIRLTMEEDGFLRGSASVAGVDDPIPVDVRLID